MTGWLVPVISEHAHSPSTSEPGRNSTTHFFFQTKKKKKRQEKEEKIFFKREREKKDTTSIPSTGAVEPTTKTVYDYYYYYYLLHWRRGVGHNAPHRTSPHRAAQATNHSLTPSPLHQVSPTAAADIHDRNGPGKLELAYRPH